MFLSGALGSKNRELSFISRCRMLHAAWGESAGHLRLSHPTFAIILEERLVSSPFNGRRIHTGRKTASNSLQVS